MIGTRTLTIGAVVAGVAMGSVYTVGLRWNTTPSMPIGLWRVHPIQGEIIRDEIVTLCLGSGPAAFGRERGYLVGGECPGDTELLIKAIAAVPGDRVVVSHDGLSVNGTMIPNSAPLPRDDAGRSINAVDAGLYIVGSTEVWVIGRGDPRSYDSRYWGAVPITNLRSQASPLLVRE